MNLEQKIRQLQQAIEAARRNMRELGMSEDDIESSINRLCDHIGNGGGRDRATLEAVMHEYVPTLGELMADEGEPKTA